MAKARTCPHRKASDQQIIDAYTELQSTKKVADLLGLAVQSVITRKRKIQNDRGIILPVRDPRPAYNTIAIDRSTAVARYQITNGRILIGSDAHIWPGPRTTMQRGFLHLARLLKPDCIVL